MVPDVVASSPRLAQVEHQLVSDVIGAQDRLAGVLGDVADRYDEVIIDCPPSLGLLTVNALFAADRVVVVTEAAAWSSDGVAQILRNVERIAERRGGRPAVAGIVLNRVGRTRDAGYWAGEIAAAHPDRLVEPHVKLRAAVAEAAAQAVAIHALSRSGALEAIAEFDALAAELFESFPQHAGTAGEPAADSGPEPAQESPGPAGAAREHPGLPFATSLASGS
ncbi:MAG: AAA family ATPase [Microthrixaceae bacterium]